MELLKWQQELIDYYTALSNEGLLDTVISLAQGDGYNGTFTGRGLWEWRHANSVLRARLKDWLMQNKETGR